MLRRCWVWLWGESARSEERAAYLHAIEATKAVAIAAMRAFEQHSAAQQAYFKLFEAQGQPETRVTREEDEYQAYLQRLGFPLHGTPEEQLHWVEAQSEHAS